MTNYSAFRFSLPLIVLILTLTATACQEPQTNTDNLHNAIAENEAIAKNYIDAYNNQDLTALEEILANPFNLNGESMDRNEFLNIVQGYWEAFPDIELKPTHIVGADEFVTVRMDFSGTGEGEYLGYNVDGKKVESSEIMLFHVNNGQLDEYWDEWDALGFWEQLDVLDSPYAGD